VHPERRPADRLELLLGLEVEQRDPDRGVEKRHPQLAAAGRRVLAFVACCNVRDGTPLGRVGPPALAVADDQVQIPLRRQGLRLLAQPHWGLAPEADEHLMAVRRLGRRRLAGRHEHRVRRLDGVSRAAQLLLPALVCPPGDTQGRPVAEDAAHGPIAATGAVQQFEQITKLTHPLPGVWRAA
jgi:hypothetical protein